MPYFTFTDASNEVFVVRIDDPALVAHARALLAGTETSDPRIGGIIVKTPAEYNIGWSYALQDVFFFEMSTEVGDSTMRYIENHLAEVGGHLLPGGVWTGWSSTLTGELNYLEGGSSRDLLLGSADADLILGKAGNDFLFGRAGDDHLAGGDGKDLVSGGYGNDKIDGGGGNDRLSGGAGDDLIFGKSGNDILAGSHGNDQLIGGQGRDTLRGGAGQDVLEGGAGNDSLTGGSGQDRFRFDTALDATSNVDAIRDFSVADDTIQLDDDIFTAVGAIGTLAASAFHTGAAAHDADDRIIYDSATGNIYYDADGNGAGAQVLFAQVTAGLALTNADFQIVG